MKTLTVESLQNKLIRFSYLGQSTGAQVQVNDVPFSMTSICGKYKIEIDENFILTMTRLTDDKSYSAQVVWVEILG